jgi:hypothetical protein
VWYTIPWYRTIDAQQMFLLVRDLPTWCRTFHNQGDVMKQIVFLSKTRSGKFGYFTNNILAWDLSREEYEMPTEWHIANANKLNFEFFEEESV